MVVVALPKLDSIICTIIQPMIRIAMKTCVEVIRAGWMSALAKVTT